MTEDWGAAEDIAEDGTSCPTEDFCEEIGTLFADDSTPEGLVTSCEEDGATMAEDCAGVIEDCAELGVEEIVAEDCRDDSTEL